MVSTAEGKFWVVTVAFSERCVLKGVRGPVAVQGLSVWYTGPQCFRTSVSQMTCGARKVSSVLRTALLNVCTVMAATPLYLSLNRLHLLSLTHNGMAATKPAVTSQYYSINRYTNLKKERS